MKILNQLEIADHTGHGVPTIVNKYGKEVFKITDNYIKVTIPFNTEVLKTLNVGINVGINVALEIVERVVLDEIIKNPQITARELSFRINKNKRTVERYLKSLQEKGYLERRGSNKNGYWKVRE